LRGKDIYRSGARSCCGGRLIARASDRHTAEGIAVNEAGDGDDEVWPSESASVSIRAWGNVVEEIPRGAMWNLRNWPTEKPLQAPPKLFD